jgi:four helix bundle protein
VRCEVIGVRRKHHELKVWQEAITLVKEVYRITVNFPHTEMYGLTSQMRRAAVSIPSNIAEGAARKSTNEFLQFLAIARGSLSELETQLVITKELGYLMQDEQITIRIDKIFGLLGGLINSIKKWNSK